MNVFASELKIGWNPKSAATYTTGVAVKDSEWVHWQMEASAIPLQLLPPIVCKNGIAVETIHSMEGVQIGCPTKVIAANSNSTSILAERLFQHANLFRVPSSSEQLRLHPYCIVVVIVDHSARRRRYK